MNLFCLSQLRKLIFTSKRKDFFTFGLFSFRCDHTVLKLSIADFLTSREVETRGAFSSNSLVTSVNQRHKQRNISMCRLYIIPNSFCKLCRRAPYTINRAMHASRVPAVSTHRKNVVRYYLKHEKSKIFAEKLVTVLVVVASVHNNGRLTQHASCMQALRL